MTSRGLKFSITSKLWTVDISVITYADKDISWSATAIVGQKIRNNLTMTMITVIAYVDWIRTTTRTTMIS